MFLLLYSAYHYLPQTFCCCFCFKCAYLFPEVTVPVSMKEVGGYIEKQVAYLSGETFEFNDLLNITCILNVIIFILFILFI